MRLPEAFVKQVVARHSIVEHISKYVTLTKHGKYLKGNCPFHSEKTPSFTVTPEKEMFYCYGCKKGGGLVKFLMEIEGSTFPEVIEKLAREAGITVPLREAPTKIGGEFSIFLQAHELASHLFHYILCHTTQGKIALEYLQNRGLSDKQIETFQIGFAPDRWDLLVQLFEQKKIELSKVEQIGLVGKRSDGQGYIDRFRNRIIFPIHNAKGEIISFAGRILSSDQPKYINSPDHPLFHKSQILFNFHRAKPIIKKQRKVVLFEGYMDVIQAWQAGVDYGIATMGTALTSEHIQVLKPLVDTIIICFDGDQAGREATMKAIELIESSGIGVQIAMLPDQMDPDEYIRRKGNFTEIMNQTISSVKFELLHLKGQYVVEEEMGKIAYIQQAIKRIAQINSPTEGEIYLKELAEEFSISFESVLQEYRQISGKKIWIPKPSPVKSQPQRVHPRLLPAYIKAEKKLLAYMMQHKDIALFVQERISENFNLPLHAALAAYLYAYYAQENELDTEKFIASLEDDKLEKLAFSIANQETTMKFTMQEIEDYLLLVQRVPKHAEIERKRKEMDQAERAGEMIRAAQIASEIIALEKDMKV